MKHVNDLAKAIAGRGAQVEIIYGTVLSYTAATATAAAVLTVDFEGAGNATNAIFLTSYSPTVGDTVVAFSSGLDTVVLGTLA